MPLKRYLQETKKQCFKSLRHCFFYILISFRPLKGHAQNSFPLELEINKWLNVATLDLNNHVDHRHNEQSLYHNVCFSNCGYAAFLPFIGYKVRNITKEHQCKYIFIAFEYLWKKLNVE